MSSWSVLDIITYIVFLTQNQTGNLMLDSEYGEVKGCIDF